MAKNKLGPSIFLHADGAVMLVSSLLVYFYLKGSWIVFILFLLVPDISLAGYLRNVKTGSIMYNLFHSYLGAAVLSLIGLFGNSLVLVQLGFIWFAHIGMDRMLGLGFKYPTTLKDTHFKHI